MRIVSNVKEVLLAQELAKNDNARIVRGNMEMCALALETHDL